MVDEGFIIGITADHGMNSKHFADGAPKVHYLGDILRDARVPIDAIVPPITDPYTRHHGALGSFAWLYLPEEHRQAARATLRQLDLSPDRSPIAITPTLFETVTSTISSSTTSPNSRPLPAVAAGRSYGPARGACRSPECPIDTPWLSLPGIHLNDSSPADAVLLVGTTSSEADG
ncbi:hypothetical protein ACWC2T_38645 [Streptomyces sp. NPDC001393]